MKVVLYERYSSNKQSELSIEGQDRVNREFCARQGYEVVGVYVDRAISGTTNNRPEFQNMLIDSEKHQWDAIVVYKLDRFSRDRYDMAIYRNKLKQNNVQLISATENINDSPESIILESVLEGMAEYYSKELSQKVKRGMEQAVLDGRFVGGRVPLGYKVENHRLAIDEEESKWVIEIFNRTATGETPTDIANDFNLRGYNRSFNKRSFQTLLHNEIYIGNYKSKHYDNLRILDDELFFRVQTQKQPREAKNTYDYLLLPKVYCGLCGDSLTGEKATGKGGVYHYYICPNHRSKRGCSLKAIRCDYLEEIVYKECLTILDDKLMSKIAEIVYKAYLDERNNLIDIKPLTDNLKRIDTKLSNAYDLLLEDKSEILKQKIADLKQQKQETESKIKELETQLPYLDKDMIEFYLTSIKDLNDKKKILDIMVNKVIVYENEIEIYFNISNNSQNGFVKKTKLPTIQFLDELYLCGNLLMKRLAK